MNTGKSPAEDSAAPRCYADADVNNDDKWVSLSVEGLSIECIGLAISAAKMFTDDDTARQHKESGDFRITQEVFKKMLEVNIMGEELLEAMLQKGSEESSA